MERGRSITQMALRLLSATIISSLLISAAVAFRGVPTVSFDDGFTPLFGDGNVVKSADGKSVNLVLNRWSGSGFISSDLYSHGLFSASIKLPSDYTAGVVVAFYTSNGDIFEKTHDEIDFEFLGNINGKEWRIQTNVYGNRSTSRGREERYLLPFDPTKEAHRYSILWTSHTIIFYIDETPIREVHRSDDYPSKPMSLYATIWDGSTWATDGGKYKANYKYAPFVVEFSNLVLRGCKTSPLQQYPFPNECSESDSELAAAKFAVMTSAKRATMRSFREGYMTYSFCYDVLRYPVTFSDCDVTSSEKFRSNGHVKHRMQSKRRNRRIARV